MVHLPQHELINVELLYVTSSLNLWNLTVAVFAGCDPVIKRYNKNFRNRSVSPKGSAIPT